MAANTTKAPRKSSTDRWEDEGGPERPDGGLSDHGQQTDLRRLGITPVQLTVFDCAGYRYSNLTDAIAAAERAIRAKAN